MAVVPRHQTGDRPQQGNVMSWKVIVVDHNDDDIDNDHPHQGAGPVHPPLPHPGPVVHSSQFRCGGKIGASCISKCGRVQSVNKCLVMSSIFKPKSQIQDPNTSPDSQVQSKEGGKEFLCD